VDVGWKSIEARNSAPKALLKATDAAKFAVVDYGKAKVLLPRDDLPNGNVLACTHLFQRDCAFVVPIVEIA
jgi:hypothetical protein